MFKTVSFSHSTKLEHCFNDCAVDYHIYFVDNLLPLSTVEEFLKALTFHDIIAKIRYHIFRHRVHTDQTENVSIIFATKNNQLVLVEICLHYLKYNHLIPDQICW